MIVVVRCALIQPCLSHSVLFRIWNSEPATRSDFINVYRDAVVCGHHSTCPQYTPDLHKFDHEPLHDTLSGSVHPEWTSESMSARRRTAQLRMSAAKLLDVAATRVLGCAPLYMLDSHGLSRDSNSTLITRFTHTYKRCPAPAAARDADPKANIISPCAAPFKHFSCAPGPLLSNATTQVCELRRSGCRRFSRGFSSLQPRLVQTFWLQSLDHQR